MLSEEEFLGWSEHPVTKALRSAMRAQVERAKERWAAGEFLDQSQFATAVENARAIGGCEAAGFIIELDYETLVTYLEE